MNKNSQRWIGIGCWLTATVCPAVTDQDLADMGMAELLEVEITLDEAFDIFNALVRKQSVSVATGKRQDAARAPSVTSVITAQDLEVMGARSLDEVLQTVPGIQVSQSWNGTWIYTIRGISTQDNAEALVLVNGARVSYSFNSSKGFAWRGFPISAIARIEIIRGPGSAIYGADAFSGVINIITKTGRDIEGTEIGARVGNYNTQDVWIVHGQRWRGFDIAAMVEYNNTNGHERTVASDGQTLLDQRFGTEVSLAPGSFDSHYKTHDLNLDIGKQHWRLRARHHRGMDLGRGAGIAQVLDPTAQLIEEQLTLDLSWANPNFTRDWGLETRLTHHDRSWEAKYNNFPPGAFGGAFPLAHIGHPTESETETRLEFHAKYQGWRNHFVQIGAGYGYYDMYEIREKKNFGPNPYTGGPISPLELVNVNDTDAAYIDETDRDSQYLFIQDAWRINARWELTTGLRYDIYSDFDNTVNPRLGLVWAPRHDLTAKLLYGRAFRAPALLEKYAQNNPVAQGNPDLKSEKIQTWELALEYRWSNTLNLALNLFRYQIEDKITLVPLDGTVYGNVNAERWQGQGGEWELRWKTSPRSSLLFNYSLQDSEDEQGNPLPNGPRQKIHLRGDYRLATKWFVDTQVNWNDGWVREAHDPRPALDGYTTMDLILRYKKLRGGQSNLAFGVRNLFDTDVRYPSPGPDSNGLLNLPHDIPGPGRFYFVDYRYTFQ